MLDNLQEPRDLRVKLRILAGALMLLFAGALLAISLHFGDKAEKTVGLVPLFVFALLCLIVRSQRILILGVIGAWALSSIAQGLLGYPWHQIAGRWVSSGILVLIIVLIYRVKRGKWPDLFEEWE